MPAQRQCLVCGAYGSIALGIRARYENTNAVWAPNLDAYLCQEHADAGCLIDIQLTARDDGRVTTATTGPRGTVRTALVIGKGMKVVPGQEEML